MSNIKTKEVMKGTIKQIDKAAVAGERMKHAYIATKDKAETGVYASENSVDEYASDKFENATDVVAHEGAHQFDKAGRNGLKTTKENIQERFEKKIKS